jgi:hypothetical protein
MCNGQAGNQITTRHGMDGGVKRLGVFRNKEHCLSSFFNICLNK